MTTLVLGHLVLDEIHLLDGRVIESPGGLAYPLMAFAAVARAGDTVLPVFPVGPDGLETRDHLFAACPELSAAGCYDEAASTTRVRLFHESANQYNSQLVASLGPIAPERFVSHLEGAGLVYVNMMTGHDILPEHAALLRGPGRLVYIDLHMIAYRVLADGRREAAPSDAWMQWVRAADVVHCNERELEALVPARDEATRIRALFDAAPLRGVMITRGERGATFHLTPTDRHHIPAASPRALVDPTGCGDTFGSVFAHTLAAGALPGEAGALAARAAAFVAGCAGSTGMRGLRAHLSGVSA
jgi:sugar/nucleoside kinase (ribokinase family)